MDCPRGQLGSFSYSPVDEDLGLYYLGLTLWNLNLLEFSLYRRLLSTVIG